MKGTINDDILTRFRKGENAAFEYIYRRYYGELYLFGKKLTGSDQEGEDIAVISFYKLFSICKNFETEANIKAFLYIAVRNASFSYLRNLKWKTEKQREFAERMENEVFFEYEYGIKSEILDKVNLAIEQLPEKSKLVFKLMYFEGLTANQIAEKLKLSQSTVFSHKHQALHTLRLLLGENSLAIAWILYKILLTETHIIDSVHSFSA
jgi:RNA polymerase sigma-70 factor (ECF subfamily)